MSLSSMLLLNIYYYIYRYVYYVCMINLRSCIYSSSDLIRGNAFSAVRVSQEVFNGGVRLRFSLKKRKYRHSIRREMTTARAWDAHGHSTAHVTDYNTSACETSVSRKFRSAKPKISEKVPFGFVQWYSKTLQR